MADCEQRNMPSVNWKKRRIKKKNEKLMKKIDKQINNKPHQVLTKLNNAIQYANIWYINIIITLCTDAKEI